MFINSALQVPVVLGTVILHDSYHVFFSLGVGYILKQFGNHTFLIGRVIIHV